MNPVLLKPQSGTGSQIVVQGRVAGQAEARGLPGLEASPDAGGARQLRPPQGGGGPRDRGRGRQRLGRSTCAPTTSPTWGFPAPPPSRWCCSATSTRGGVIAQIVGTRAVLDPGDAAMVAGFHRQPLPGRPDPVHRGHGADRGAHRLAGARPGAALPGGGAAAGGGLAGAARLAPQRRRHAGGRGCRLLPGHLQLRRPRSAAPRAGCAPRRGAARGGGCRPRPASWCCPARRRRSPTCAPCAARDGTSTSPPTSGAAATSSACAAATRCWGLSVDDPDGVEGPPGRV